jgi:hypothetical protein
MTQEISASRLGKSVEYLVAASCVLASDGKLNVSTSMVDDEGVDLVFHRSDHVATLAVQVKSRSLGTVTLSQYERFLANVRSETFRPRPSLYVLFVAADVPGGTFDLAWLVPSEVLAARARPNARGRLRFSASPKANSADQWREYRVSRAELPQRILSVLDSLER